MTGDKMLFLNWYYLGVKAFSSHAYQTGSRYLLRVLLEISAEPHCPVPFVWKSPLPPPPDGMLFHRRRPPSILFTDPCKLTIWIASTHFTLSENE